MIGGAPDDEIAACAVITCHPERMSDIRQYISYKLTQKLFTGRRTCIEQAMRGPSVRALRVSVAAHVRHTLDGCHEQRAVLAGPPV